MNYGQHCHLGKLSFSIFNTQTILFLLIKLICCYHLEIPAVFAADSKEEDLFIPPLLTTAMSLLDDLVVTQKITTVYSHENTVNDRELKFNCYGFILHLINAYNREAFEELLYHMNSLHHVGIQKSLDEARPSPYNFFHIFKGLSEDKLHSLFWEGIADIFTLIPGDLLVYLKPGFVSPKKWRKNVQPVTHIMLISAIISKTSDTLEIEIIDSAHQPHNDVNDTRHKLQIKGGLGKALLLITKTEMPGIYSLAWKKGQKCIQKELFGGRLLPKESR